MRISEYLHYVYEPDGSGIFHNVPNFIAKLFSAGGSDKFGAKNHTQGSHAGDYAYKIYGSSRCLSKNIKKSFRKFNRGAVIIFFERYFQQECKVKTMMSTFGISCEEEINKTCFFTALAMQFELFINSKEDDVDNIVAKTYYSLTKLGNDRHYPNNTQYVGEDWYRYSLIIYEDDSQVRDALKQHFERANRDQTEKFYIEVSDNNAAPSIIQESTERNIDAYIIDIARPCVSVHNSVYTDYSYSGKDLFEELLRIKIDKVKEGTHSNSAFFIYSTMASSELREIFTYTDSIYLCDLSSRQKEDFYSSVKIVLLKKADYSERKVAERVRTYFEDKYNEDYIKAVRAKP